MNDHTITLTQLELETIIDVLDTRATRNRFAAEALTDPALADIREALEKDAATYDDLWGRLCEIAASHQPECPESASFSCFDPAQALLLYPYEMQLICDALDYQARRHRVKGHQVTALAHELVFGRLQRSDGAQFLIPAEGVLK